MTNKIQNITLGSDPEYFVKHIPTNTIVSGIGFVGGTKNEPLILDNETGITRTEDCTLAEFQFPPVTSKEDWLYMFKKLVQKGNEHLGQYDMCLVTGSSHIYDDAELLHPMARTFGCSPSTNAWTKETQYSCGPEEAGNLRSAGAHIHIGTTSDISEDDAYNLIRVLDVFLGVPSVLIDTDTQRRKLYGKAGECRFRVIKGVIVMEYRTLGGNMLESEELIGWIYDQTMKAIEYYNTEGVEKVNAFREEIIDCIDNVKENLAKDLMSIFNLTIPYLEYVKIHNHA